MGRPRIVKWKGRAAFLERLRQLRETRWNGNASAMSRALGVSVPVMSKILNGKQHPSGQLFEALIMDPEINMTWLFRGEKKEKDDPVIAVDAAMEAMNKAWSALKHANGA